MIKRLFVLVFALVSFNAYSFTEISGNGMFQIDYASDCAPATVTFTDLGIIGASGFEWDFGDGSPVSNSANPSHNYANAGVYTVYVTYLDGSGLPFSYDYFYLYLNGDPGSVDAYTTTGCIGDRMVFYIPYPNPSGLNGYSFTWNYGDGVIETHPYPSSEHVYTATGNYNLSVTVNTPCGTFVETLNITIGTNVPLTTGYFDLWPEEICPGDQVYVNYGGSTSQFITFGDGTFGTDSYTHEYSQTGVYPVVATLTNGCGNSQTFYDTVRVQNNLDFNPNMGIDFWNSGPACLGMEIEFSTSAMYNSVFWQFPDGTTSNTYEVDKIMTSNFSSNPTYLTVTNGCGFDTTVNFTITQVSSLPIDDIEMTVSASVCTGAAFLFSADGNDNPDLSIEYFWDFGDGTTSTEYSGNHIYTTDGTYTVTLTAVNACGNDSTQTAVVTAGANVAPDAALSELFLLPEDGGCAGDSVLFVFFPGLPGDYAWDFGDGNSYNGHNTLHIFGRDYAYVKHRYNSTGTYSVSCTYTNSCGLSITKVQTFNVGTSLPVEAEILFDPTSVVCFGDPVTFSAYGGETYEWDFGDNTGTFVTNSTFVPIQHNYQQPGPYTVNLRVTNGCGNVDIETINVVVPDSRISISTSTFNSQCGQNTGKALAVISGGNPPYELDWTTGDTTILVDSLYSGIYVCNVTDRKGCYNFALATISDVQAPSILINNVLDVSCYGGNDGVIDINVVGNSGPYTFEWSNGATSEDIGNLVAGPYELIVTDANGCQAVQSIYVGQPDPVSVTFLTQPASCGGNDGDILAVANGNSGPFTYVWNNGTVNAELFNVPMGIYTVNVIDQNGCFVTESVALSESNTVPGPGFGGPAILTSSISPLNCNGPGATINIEVVQSSGNLSYSWNTGAATQDLTVSAEGEYNVMVTDLTTGCKAIAIFHIDHSAPAGQPICMVSVDSMYSFNRVVWEKPVTTEISHYNIYRESSQNGLYYLIGTVPYDSLSQFNDYVANPMITAWRYRLSAVDYCGEESEWSEVHKTIHLTQNLGLTGTINLLWDHYDGFEYTTYEVIRYTSSTGWQSIATVSSANTSYTDPTPPSDPSLFYVIETNPLDVCVATRAINNNTTRSNRTQNPVAPPMSVNEVIGSIEGIAVYPNPNNGQFTFEADFIAQDDANVAIYSMEGKLVSEFSFSAVSGRYNRSIDLGDVPAGIYFLRLYNESSSFVKKIVID